MWFPVVVFHVKFISIKLDHATCPFGFVIVLRMEVTPAPYFRIK